MGMSNKVVAARCLLPAAELPGAPGKAQDQSPAVDRHQAVQQLASRRRPVQDAPVPTLQRVYCCSYVSRLRVL
jgi:hypothetical protein